MKHNVPKELVERLVDSAFARRPEISVQFSEEQRELFRKQGCLIFEEIYSSLEGERRNTLNQVIVIIDTLTAKGVPIHPILRSSIEDFRDMD